MCLAGGQGRAWEVCTNRKNSSSMDLLSLPGLELVRLASAFLRRSQLGRVMVVLERLRPPSSEGGGRSLMTLSQGIIFKHHISHSFSPSLSPSLVAPLVPLADWPPSGVQSSACPGLYAMDYITMMSLQQSSYIVSSCVPFSSFQSCFHAV